MFVCIVGICSPSAQAAAKAGTGHRTNILNSNFTEMRAGYAVDRTGRSYYVQVFARPLS